ncbi:hypothetical protein NM208_g17172 [Fusarium decemcellulare]|uniref:Uncharacterized protein n=1 Tax=Fusarium decemcellulare TaxID=57161 RepID=A0ACC1R8M6_9HYPO|nr:hypothetical protein NM208_g17172 [Fusarium decemcellulare]
MAAAQESVAKMPVKVEEPAKKKASIRYPFWFGGSASSMAACVTHPLDLVKVRFLPALCAVCDPSSKHSHAHRLLRSGSRCALAMRPRTWSALSSTSSEMTAL